MSKKEKEFDKDFDDAGHSLMKKAFASDKEKTLSKAISDAVEIAYDDDVKSFLQRIDGEIKYYKKYGKTFLRVIDELKNVRSVFLLYQKELERSKITIGDYLDKIALLDEDTLDKEDYIKTLKAIRNTEVIHLIDVKKIMGGEK